MFILAVLLSQEVQIHLLRRAAALNENEMGISSEDHVEVLKKTEYSPNATVMRLAYLH